MDSLPSLKVKVSFRPETERNSKNKKKRYAALIDQTLREIKVTLFKQI